MLELISEVTKMLIYALQKDNEYDREDNSKGRGVIVGCITAYSNVLQSAGYRVECNVRNEHYSSVRVGDAVFPI